MFEGVYTAIITPFQADGSVDYETLRMLVRRQRDAGIDGVVPVGTTGESPVLDYQEHLHVIEAVVEVCAETGGCCKDRMKVLAGTGANSTSEARELSRQARVIGVDGTLQVTPYYNKPSQEGLYRHFVEVAEKSELPVVLYNVPGRTSREIDVHTIERLSKHDLIVGVKEAGGRADRVSQIRDVCDLPVLSGDDALTLPMMAVGAVGVISVAANIIPHVMKQLVDAARGGRWDEARAVHRGYYRVFSHLFLEANPIPVKAALAMMGLCEERYRLPLCEMAAPLREQLQETLTRSGIL